MNVQQNAVTSAASLSPDAYVRSIVFPPEERGKTRRLAVAYTTSSNGRFAWAKLMPDGSWNFDRFCRPEERADIACAEKLVRFKMLAYCEGLGLVESWELREQQTTHKR